MSKIEIIKTTLAEFNVPKRADFVNPKLHEKIVSAVATKQPMYFEPHDCQDNSEYINGKQIYVVYMFGIMVDGTKTMVILTGISVYFDILISNNEIVSRGPSINAPEIGVLEISHFKTSIKEGIGADLYNNISRIEIVEGYPPKRFQTQPSKYLRLFFDNLYSRAKVLEAVQKLYYDKRQEVPFELAHDDLSRNNPSYYFNVVARTYKFNTCSWNVLEAGKYTVCPKDTQNNPSTKCKYCFRVDINNFKPLDDQTISKHDYLNKSRQIVMTWDIETYSSDRQTGEIPSPEAEDTNIFMICATFHWQFTEKALLKVCCVDNPTSATPDVFFDMKALEAQSKTTGKPIEELAREQSQVNVLIECGNERDLCIAFARVVSQMAPDFIGAFNGGSFDWPFYRERMHKYGLMRELYNCFSALKPTYIENDTKKVGGRCSIYRRRFKEEKVKISAEESATMLCAQFPGMIDTDIMIVFKQIYTKAEVGRGSSLNFYLKVNKLQGKEDLPYKEMFHIYEKSSKWVERQKALERGDLTMFDIANTAELSDDDLQSIIKSHDKNGQENRDAMALVAKYCVVDAFRCQQLYTVKSIIADRKEVSNMAYLTIYDAFYRANGMKVRNLVGSFCCDPRFNIMFSNGKQTNVKIKYPGAHVFPPKKGLNNKRPVVGLDFSSLYPSLMMAYNLSPEKAIDEINLEIDTISDRGYNHVCAARKFAEDLAKIGYDLHYTKFDGTIQDENRPDNGKIVTVSGWIVRHSNIIENGDKPRNKQIESSVSGAEKPRDTGLQGEKMGVFPFILKILFDKRKKIKNRFIALSKLIEIIDILRKDNSGKSDKEIFALINANDFNDTGFSLETCDYAEIKFQRNAVNSKQNALKVYMNTFYGEQGNYLSSIYKLLVAGGITSAGQYNIKMVADYLVKNKYCVWYGDTDSNYISCDDSLFVETDRVYDDAKNLLLREIKNSFDERPLAEGKDISAEARTIVSKLAGPYITEFSHCYEKQEHALAKKAINAEDFKKWNQNAYEELVKQIIEASLNYIKPQHIYLKNTSLNHLTDDELNFQVMSMFRFVLREIYWTQLVQITRRDLNDLRVKVNSMLASDNGTAYLTMAYEEVLFPVVFTGKKKYFGLAHLEKENFHPAPKDIFVRGIDIIKQGQAKLAKDIGYEILAEICSAENELEMIDIVHKAIEKIYSRDWSLEYFVLNGKYKPNKQNVPIQTFVSRMRRIHAKYDNQNSHEYNPNLAALYTPPIPGDTFQYVIVKYDQAYDLRGNKINLKKGDKMEYLTVFNHLSAVAKCAEDKPRIDLNHYISGAIIGLFARFLAYRPEFQPPATITDPEEIDIHSVREANKYVEKYCEKRAGIDREALVNQGRGLRKNSKLVQKSMKQNIISKYGQSAHVLLNIIGISDNVQYDHKYDSNNPEISLSTKQELEIARQKHEANMRVIKEYAKRLAGEPFLGQRLLDRYAEKIAADPTFIYALKLTYSINGGFSRSERAKKEASGINLTSVRLNHLNNMVTEYETKISNMLKYIIDIEKYEIYKCDELLQASSVDQTFDFQGGFNDLAVIKTEDEQNYKKTLDEYNSAILRLSSLYKLRDNYADVPIKINEYINKKLRVQQRVVISKEELKKSEYDSINLGKLHDY